MSSSFGPNFYQEIFTRLTLAGYGPGDTPSPPVQPFICEPGRTLPVLIQPYTDRILHILCPTDTHLLPPRPAGDPPAHVAFHAALVNLGTAIEPEHAKLRDEPVLFLQGGGILAPVGCTDGPRYAARAALRFASEELDEEMYRLMLGGGVSTWEAFKPLVYYRLACMAALVSLINLGPPPAEVIREYA